MSRIWAGAFFAVIALAVFVYIQEREIVPEGAAPVATTTVASTTTTTVRAAVTSAASTTIAAIKDIATPPETGWKRGVATIFWVGEGEGEDNGYITNVESAWDMDWMEHFGGVDDPDTRCGHEPCAFDPQENSFYVALPYNDLGASGNAKANATRIPWYRASDKSILKNRWIEVRFKGKVCYGQWEDVGPFHEDDIEYVFGTAVAPLNTMGEKAGIDLSPAVADCLGVDGSDTVEWRHVDSARVPGGPWKETITTRISQ